MSDLYPLAVTSAANSSATLSEMFGLADSNKIVVSHIASDDGHGSFLSDLGTINYAGKSLSLRVVRLDRTTTGYQADHESAAEFDRVSAGGAASAGAGTARGGQYERVKIMEGVLAGSSVIARYRTGAAAPRAKTQSITPPAVVLSLRPLSSEPVVPGSVLFRWMSHDYSDFEGVIYRDRTDTSPGVVSGKMNYATGNALMTDWVVGGTGPTDLQLLSLWTRKGQWSTASMFFTVDLAPLKAGAGGFVLTVVDLTGATLTAAIDAQGVISGSHMRGRVEFSRGAVELQFGDFLVAADLSDAEKAEWWYSAADVGAVQPGKVWRPWPVDPTTMRYSAVSYIYLPVDVSLMGLDPAALAADGRATFVRPGDTCTVGVQTGGSAFAASAGLTYSTGTERLSSVMVIDDLTKAEVFTGYTADLDAGTVNFTDVTGYPAHVRVIGFTEVYCQVAEVRIDGRVRLTKPIGHAFPAGAVFSTAVRFGDRFAHVESIWDQASWDGVTWKDAVDPARGDAPGTYAKDTVKLEVNNLGAITEQWALRLRSDGQTFDLIGKHLGQIASGNINTDFSPMNIAAGAPYMTVKAAGWGGLWVGGNVLFVKTVGAEAPIAVLRCTQPSSPAGIQDSCLIVQRGSNARAPGNSFD